MESLLLIPLVFILFAFVLWFVTDKTIRVFVTALRAVLIGVFMLSFCMVSMVTIIVYNSMSGNSFVSNGRSSSGPSTVPNNVPAEYAQYVQEASELHGVDPSLIAGIITIESKWNPKARSYANARGLMQLMPATGGELGLYTEEDFFDPRKNIMAGTEYLAYLQTRFPNDPDLVVISYHRGPNSSVVRDIDREYLRRFKAVQDTYSVTYGGDDCDFGPIYDRAQLTQGIHGQSYGDYAIDIAGGYGSTVYSPINGRATLSTGYMGNTVITIENSCYTVKMLHGNWIASGNVNLGEPVGSEASIGHSFGPHTHIDVFDKRLGYKVNPLNFKLTR